MPTFTLSTGPHGTKEVFDYLIVCAKHMYTDNYKHICAEVDKRSKGRVKIVPMGIGQHLGWIREQCIENMVPWINAIAVGLNAKDPKNHWRPSHGFLPKESDWKPSHEVLWRGMVLQVFSYDWSSVTLA